MSGRSQSGQPKSGSRQEGAPPDVDMEEAPPSMSDGDVCMPATSQSSHLASAAVSAGFLAFCICLILHTPLYLYCSFSVFFFSFISVSKATLLNALFVFIPVTFLILSFSFFYMGAYKRV